MRCFLGFFPSNRPYFRRISNRLFTHFKLFYNYTTSFQKSQENSKIFFSSVILTALIFLLITAIFYISFRLIKKPYSRKQNQSHRKTMTLIENN